jgi:hypothetical protein
MIYFKSVLAGIVAALVSCVVVAVSVPLILFIPSIFSSASTGSGGIGAVSAGLPELVLLLVVPVFAFAGGFYWQFRRGSRPRS